MYMYLLWMWPDLKNKQSKKRRKLYSEFILKLFGVSIQLEKSYMKLENSYI